MKKSFLYKISYFLKEFFFNLWVLKKTKAPMSVFLFYVKTFLKKIFKKKYEKEKNEFQIYIKNGKFSNDWFSANIPYWLEIFSDQNFSKKAVTALEIGSWEGGSSCFIMQSLPNAQLTCVDTWAGADEHQGREVLNEIEKNYDKNIEPYAKRLIKFKGTSFEFFNSCKHKKQFDFIYIDGSHHADDVIVDAIKGFEQLKVGGIMIFDDYFWCHYENILENPAAAINSFLNLKKGSYRLLAVYWQVIIQKIKDTR